MDLIEPKKCIKCPKITEILCMEPHEVIYTYVINLSVFLKWPALSIIGLSILSLGHQVAPRQHKWSNWPKNTKNNQKCVISTLFEWSAAVR